MKQSFQESDLVGKEGALHKLLRTTGNLAFVPLAAGLAGSTVLTSRVRIRLWHAFLLNPRLFMNHCGRQAIYRRPFPWQQIHHAIDNRDWSFAQPEDAAGVTGFAYVQDKLGVYRRAPLRGA